MPDIEFDEIGNVLGEKEATLKHQKNILVMHKGWNPFAPHIGVGIDEYLDDESTTKELESSIRFEFARDGMQVNNVNVSTTGEIQIDAKY